MAAIINLDRSRLNSELQKIRSFDESAITKVTVRMS